jgi:L-alanine-DL-glutamate epimerase-like enolase superfamily enzyme
MTRRELWTKLSAAGLAPLALAAQSAPSLRISGFDIVPVRVPFSSRVREPWIASWKNQKRGQIDFAMRFVRLHTAEGITGIGEAKMPRSQAEALLKKMVGRSPWDYLLDDSLRGILIAVYDLLGKATGKSVARLFAETPQAKVTPVWWSQCFPPDVMASEAKLGASRGYRIHKVKARPWIDAVKQAEAICAVVPKGYKVWADANATWETADKAIEMTERLAKFPNYFAVESPIARANVDGYRQLRGKLALPVAEHVDGIDVEQWTREGLLDAWIVAGARMGRGLERLAALSKQSSKPIWVEHSIDNGIAEVFQAHQAAAWPTIQYCISVTNVLEDDCMKEPFTVRDGQYTIPDKPGLGVSLDEAAIEKYRDR